MSARRLALVLAALLLVPAARAAADTGPVSFDVAVAGSQTVTGTYAYQPPACWSLQGSSHETTTFHTDGPARLVLRRATDGSLTGTTRVALKGSTERQGGLDLRQPPGCNLGIPAPPPGDCGTQIGDFDAQLTVTTGRLHLQGVPGGTFESCPLWQPTTGTPIMLDANGGVDQRALDAGAAVAATATGDLPQHVVSDIQGVTTIDADTKSSSTLTLTPLVHHYEVQLQGWIAQAHVVDPLAPVPLPYAAVMLTGGCLSFADAARFATVVTSAFHGDGHAGYDGTHRGLEVASFDWDGERITNFTEHGDFGLTSRDMVYHGPFAAPRACSQTGRATKTASGATTGTRDFELKLSAANPLIPLDLAPTADQELAGHLEPDGTLHLRYDTDLFPSAGVRVLRDGQALGTYIVNDTSCVPEPDMLGPAGIGLLTRGLVSHDVHGSLTVAPTDAHALRLDASPLCSHPTTAGLDVIDAGTLRVGSPATDSRASAASAGTPSLTLAAAQRQGLLTATVDGHHTLISITSDAPLKLTADRPGAVAAIRAGRRTRTYGPAGTKLTVRVGQAGITVRDGTHRLAPRAPDTTPPRTRARSTRNGRTATIRLTANDRSGVATTVATLGGRLLRSRHGSFHVPFASLRRVRYCSIDVFGNAEALRRIDTSNSG